jgi:hypothetical protein
MTESIWLGRIQSDPVVTQSALEKWIIQNEGSHSPNWQFLNENGKTLFGTTTYCAVGGHPLPPIYTSRPILDDFVQKASSGEISALVNVLRTGTFDEQEAALKQAQEALYRKQ